MPFDSEQALREAVRPILGSVINEDNIKFIEEFEYGSGIADIVAYRVSDCYLERRFNELELTNSIKNEKILKEFLLLRSRGEVSKNYYFSIGGRSEYQKKKALDWLVDHGFVWECGDSIRTAPNLRRHITTSYSIELKLKDWKEALKQAQRGKSFSEYQFVLLDQEYISRPLRHRDVFEKRGIGLISFSESGDYSVEIDADRKTAFSSVNKWRLNEKTITLGSVIGTKSHARVAGD